MAYREVRCADTPHFSSIFLLMRQAKVRKIQDSQKKITS
jgi:hypothetical protein